MTTRPSRPFGPIIAGAICLAILSGMIVVHAWPLWTGQPVLLRVNPVDPRDWFRGEYVRLSTPGNNLLVGSHDAALNAAIAVTPDAAWWAGLPSEPMERASVLSRQIVYVQLEPSGERGEHQPVAISPAPVPGRLNLRGRVRSSTNSPGGTWLSIDYGLDRYFMQEGKARPVEQSLRAGRRLQMEVVISSSGRARIRRLLIDGVPVEP